jgi:uncharacterized protein (DUF2062 family)
MWHWSRADFERRLESFLHTHDTPHRTAVALGLGVAVGFSPFIGLHLPIGILLAFTFNLNRVAVIGGVCANLPWIMGFYYATTTAMGTWILGVQIPERLMRSLKVAWEIPQWAARIDAVAVILQPLLWPFILGSTIGCVVLGLAAYYLARPILTAIRQRRDHLHAAQRSNKSANPFNIKS